MNQLEAELRRRYELRSEWFREGAMEIELVLPARPDELIDVSDFNVDERLPYWAELWPSARALARHLLRSPPRGGSTVLELGCGVALPSLALRSLGYEVLATDYYPEALAFAAANAARNAIEPPRTLLLDWRKPPHRVGRYPLVLAADVLYELRNAEALASLLPHLLLPGGAFLLADPGRAYRSDFDARLRALGWSIETLAVRQEPAAPEAGEPTSSISLVSYRTPAEPPPKL